MPGFAPNDHIRYNLLIIRIHMNYFGKNIVYAK